MMLRVVEREAQTLSHKKHHLTFEVDNTLKVLGSEDELRCADPLFTATATERRSGSVKDA
jgi:hypothetical protein